MRDRILAAVLAAAFLCLAASEHLVSKEDKIPPMSEQSLTGYWRKITEGGGSSRYPTKVEFWAGGVYDAPGSPEAGAYWHGGDWMIDQDGRIVIQVANDAMVPYKLIEFSGAQLTLEDDDGCQFTYQRCSE